MPDDQTDQAPIATYRERLLRVRRRFDLFPDRVVVNASWLFGRTFRHTVQLADLKPQTTEFRIRQRLLKKAIPVTALAVAAAVVLNRPGYEAIQPWAIYALYGLAVLGGLVILLTWPKVLFVRFPSRRDQRPGLDIARAGPDEAGFSDFVDLVKRQIRRQ